MRSASSGGSARPAGFARSAGFAGFEGPARSTPRRSSDAVGFRSISSARKPDAGSEDAGELASGLPTAAGDRTRRAHVSSDAAAPASPRSPPPRDRPRRPYDGSPPRRRRSVAPAPPGRRRGRRRAGARGDESSAHAIPISRGASANSQSRRRLRRRGRKRFPSSPLRRPSARARGVRRRLAGPADGGGSSPSFPATSRARVRATRHRSVVCVDLVPSPSPSRVCRARWRFRGARRRERRNRRRRLRPTRRRRRVPAGVRSPRPCRPRRGRRRRWALRGLCTRRRAGHDHARRRRGPRRASWRGREDVDEEGEEPLQEMMPARGLPAPGLGGVRRRGGARGAGGRTRADRASRRPYSLKARGPRGRRAR